MRNGNHRLLIVEDDKLLREQLWWSLKKDYEVFQAGDRAAAIESVIKHQPDLILLDLHLPPDNNSEGGILLLKNIRRQAREAVIIVMTGDQKKESALRAMEEGAYDYFRKPVDLAELKMIIHRALEKFMIEKENRMLREKFHQENSYEGIIGVSKAMGKVFDSIRRVADSNATVILRGESGTGKDLVARAIHNTGPRKKKPFIAVQCSALPEHLIESELFGHEKGAFTGAVNDRAGRFEMAHQGTLFLDEIGTMSPTIQAKLLRILEQKEFLRLGAKEPVQVDVRLITATNEDLEARIREGKFREDLYFRVHVFPLHLPALRQRREDIPLLVKHFLKVFCDSHGVPGKGITADAMETLSNAPWPGNVRQLKNFVMTLVLTIDSERITSADLPTGHALPSSEAGQAFPAVTIDGLSLPEAVERFEAQLLKDALQKTEGIKVEAAKLLGVDKTRMMYLCRKHHI